ncbi:effector-associated constant component EACC1 [Streptosporangium amethystogenes]|uniref:effector-associated constant component EACC1 n=1 Tax=Streptosporangium amethystogenes TaxID=2002 RepID=UPI00068AF431|nr:hypothetical protein [Streptosporangium amethystogenes]
MEILVTVTVGDAADGLRNLRSWLVEEPELRGRVGLVEAEPAAGALGPVPEMLQVVFGAGGALATLAGVVIAWLGNRGGEVTVKLTRGEAVAEISAKGVKSLDLAQTRALTMHLAEVLKDAEVPRGAG